MKKPGPNYKKTCFTEGHSCKSVKQRGFSAKRWQLSLVDRHGLWPEQSGPLDLDLMVASGQDRSEPSTTHQTAAGACGSRRQLSTAVSGDGRRRTRRRDSISSSRARFATRMGLG
jgi:hypothetical protein